MSTVNRLDGRKTDDLEPATSPLQPWETPELGELDVSQTAIRPGVGTDGGSFDCSRT
jgi:hypothetical protein